MECIILSVNDTYMDAQEVMHMTDYSKITALYLCRGDYEKCLLFRSICRGTRDASVKTLEEFHKSTV